MTTQETIRTLKMEMLGDSEQMKYAKQIAIEALEKQIPKKPTAHKVDVPKIKVGNGFLEKAQQFIVALVVTNL